MEEDEVTFLPYPFAMNAEEGGNVTLDLMVRADISAGGSLPLAPYRLLAQ